jgi:uroporphyrinogen-III synthase
VTDTPPTILLTRPEAQSHETAGRLRARIGAAVPILVSPILGIDPVDVDLPARPRVLILTSVHGAAAAGRVPALAGLRAWCVGDRTAEAARAAGLAAVSAGGDAEDLLALLTRERPEGPGLHLHGRHIAADLAQALTSAGLETHSAIAYDQTPRPLSPEALACLAWPGRVILPLYSPRSARLLAAETAGSAARREVVAMSAQVAEAWPDPSEVAAIAAAPEAAAMEDAIVARLAPPSAC